VLINSLIRRGAQIVLALVFITILPSCHRGTGCPAENAKPKVDKNGNPKSKPKSGLYDKKGRMNSSGYKNDHRKPKKHTN